MGTSIFYYSGTGNSLWAARKIAAGLEDAKLYSIAAHGKKEADLPESETLGLVFPVYIWGVPEPVVRFLDALKSLKPEYVFAVAVNGGQVAGTLLELETLMLHRGMMLSAGFGLVTPSNYIPWGGPGSKEKVEATLKVAEERLVSIAGVVKRQETFPPEKGPFWQRVLLGLAHRLSFKHVHEMDKSFYVDAKCNGCGICVKVCPASNITLDAGKPLWHRNCEQCLACIQWCPQQAIQAGKKTPGYERYHHPAVTLKDIVDTRESFRA